MVEPACLRLPMARSLVGPSGLVADEGMRAQLADVRRAIADHVAAASGGTEGG